MLLGYLLPSATAAVKFIIKSLLFAQKIKDVVQAETEDWLCFSRGQLVKPQ